MLVDEAKLSEQSEMLKNDLQYFEKFGRPVVDEYSKELDEKVASIRSYLNQIREYNLEFDVLSLQKIVIDLSSTIYYTSEKLEHLSLLEDMSKVKYKDKYNEAYTSRQEGATVDKRKFTTDQLRALADQEAVEEQLLHFIYTHAAAILKGKIDAANDLLRATSKALSAQIQSMQSFCVGQRHS